MGSILPAPVGVEPGQWNAFIVSTICIWFLDVGGIFLWYFRRYYRRIKILTPKDIFLQQKPWVDTFWICGALAFAVDFGLGIAVVSERSLGVIGNEFELSLVGAAVTMLCYWLLSLLANLPVRVKYVPYLKRKKIRRLE